MRGYYLNLSSHPAYEDFRSLRAKLKAAGTPLTSMALAADAVFRDEPVSFILSAAGGEAAAELRAEIEDLRDSGELARIIARMRLD